MARSTKRPARAAKKPAARRPAKPSPGRARGPKRQRQAPASARTAPAADQMVARRAIRASAGIAPGMQPVNVLLPVGDIKAALAFYDRALGFTPGGAASAPSGERAYADLRHGASVVMLVPRTGTAAAGAGGSATVYVYVEDVDRIVAQAREAGVTIADAEDQPWGDRTASFTDPDGHRWTVATFKKLVPFEPA